MKKSILLLVRCLVLLAAFSITFSSCMTTKTSVGEYQQQQGAKYKYSKGKQVWLFWGLLPVGRTNINTPGDGNCEVVSRFNVLDFVIGGLTAGIVSTRTIKVNAKKGGQGNSQSVIN